jgi:hypothetical protein
LSLIGVVTNKDRRAGVLGLVITGVLIAWIVLGRFC